MLSQRMVAAGECRAGSRRWKGKPEAAAMRDRLRLLPAPCACVFPTTLCLFVSSSGAAEHNTGSGGGGGGNGDCSETCGCPQLEFWLFSATTRRRYNTAPAKYKDET